MSKNLKPTKKPNPYARQILVQFKVNAEEMRVILGKSGAFTKRNVSELCRVAVLTFKPSKEDFQK